ncbi:hypothetical protein OIV83_005464 [Microbotryomycetes sp. JL201]|nr:hypothetical protein OIV83_005464 [Microbotryomycetes sp. JL201]
MSYPDVFAGPASSSAEAMIGHLPQSSMSPSQTPTLLSRGALDSIIANTSSADAFSLAAAYPQAFQPMNIGSASNGVMIPGLPQSLAPTPTISLMSNQMPASSSLSISPLLTLPSSSQGQSPWGAGGATLAPPIGTIGVLTPTTEQALNQAIEASLSPVSPLSATTTMSGTSALTFGPNATQIELGPAPSVVPTDTVSLAPSLSDASVGVPPSESPNQAKSPSPRKRTFLEMVRDDRHESTRAAIDINEAPLSRNVARCYGKEKRLLSPPPIVRIVGPLLQRVPRPRLKMEVINLERNVQTACEQSRFTSDADRAYFRKLHINGMGKAKNFNLRLSVHPAPEDGKGSKSNEESSGEEELLPPVATFMSADIDVISKPSKKMVNGLATQSTISQSSTVAFLSRLSNQSARTYFMSVEDGQVLSRLDEWSAFSMRIVSEPEDAPKASTAPSRPLSSESQTVPCGSEIVLTDILTGYETESLTIHQIDKDEVIFKHTGPVGQMQRVALSRLTPNGKRIFLTTKSDGLDFNGNPMSAAARRKPRKRTKKDDGESEMRPVLSYEEAISFTKPSIDHPLGVPRVGDHMTWTIVGVTSFSYSLFESRPSQSGSIERPLTPFPILVSAPKYIQASHCLEVDVTDFFYTNPNTHAADAVAKQVHVQPTARLIVELPPCSMVVQAAFQQESYASHSAAGNGTLQSPALHTLQDAGGNTNDLVQQALAKHSVKLSSDSLIQSNMSQAVRPPSVKSASPEALVASLPANAGASSSLDQTFNGSSLFDSKTPSISNSPPVVGNGSLPLVIIRPCDGVGYLTGRWVNASLDDKPSKSAGRTDSDDPFGNAGWTITIT